MPRLFYAVDLPDEIKDELGPLAASLRNIGPYIRPVGRGNYHTTLLFLGDQPDQAVPHLCKIGSDSVAAARPCSLSIGLAGFFPQVSFLTLTGDIETLTVVARVLADQCQDYLEKPEDRPYKAHVTVARHKENIRPDDKIKIRTILSPLDGRSWIGRELILFESDLTPRGPIYTCLARFPFTG